MILGAHQSIAGGLHRAFERAEADTARSFQIFTRNARGWAGKALDPGEAVLFRAAAARTGLPVVAHGSYLVNLAAEDGPHREKSLATSADELSRCALLGVKALIIHPGSHPDVARGTTLIARGLDEVLARAVGDVPILLETTAGQGVSIGHRFEHLAELLSKVSKPERLGICLDTCHLYAAGYDIKTEKGYEATLGELDRLVGLSRVKAFHLNDCKKPLGCRVDRHADIGTGTLGLEAFRPFLTDPRFQEAVGVLETPGFDRYRHFLQKLRELAGEPKVRAPRRKPSQPAAKAKKQPGKRAGKRAPRPLTRRVKAP